MYFVIDNQAPVVAGKKREMGKVFWLVVRLALASVREDLVGAHGDGGDRFALPGIFRDHLRRHVGFIDNLVDPLAYGHRIGSQDERCTLDIGHRYQAHYCLARATWQHHDPAAATGSSSCVKRG